MTENIGDIISFDASKCNSFEMPGCRRIQIENKKSLEVSLCRAILAYMKKAFFHGLAVACAAATMLVTGCLTDYSGSAYDKEFVRMPHTISHGVITRMDYAKIEGEAGIVGGAAGGILGAAGGSAIGGGSGNTIATALGMVGGAAIGAAAQKKATTQNAVEFTVKLDNGNELSIVQTLGPDTFVVGQAVRILTAPDGTSRIRPE